MTPGTYAVSHYPSTNRKYIDQYWLEERIAIRTEQIARPTPRELHDALNETLREFEQLYGEVDIPQWPRASASPAPRS